MGQLRDKMSDDLKLRGYRASTIRKYLTFAHNFVAHFRRCPTTMGEPELRAFLLYVLEEKRVAPSTLEVARSLLQAQRESAASSSLLPSVVSLAPDFDSETESEDAANPEEEDFAQRLLRLCGIDVLRCPACPQGRLVQRPLLSAVPAAVSGTDTS